MLFLSYVSNICVLIFLFFYFQWLGDDKLRRILEGKLVMIHLVCKKATNGSNASISSFTGATSAKDTSTPKRQIFRPCVALRIAGSPGKTYYKHIKLAVSQFKKCCLKCTICIPSNNTAYVNQ